MAKKVGGGMIGHRPGETRLDHMRACASGGSRYRFHDTTKKEKGGKNEELFIDLNVFVLDSQMQSQIMYDLIVKFLLRGI